MDHVGMQFAPIISDNPYDLHGHITNGFNFSQQNVWNNRDDRNFALQNQNSESISRSSTSDGARTAANKTECHGKGKRCK